jgi:SAM-dependent methyltransferase
MAIVWRQTIESNHYEVRSAGATLRLYRNGVNHSQWNPNRPLSGCIWDLIALPALYRPQGSIESVLMLGFGAGTVARKLRDLVEPEHIVGIELDPIHLSIADGFFDCTEGCELVAADAVEWVQTEASESDRVQFDMIIDDLYAEELQMAVRCAPLDLEWCQHLAKLVKPGGMLVFNMIEPRKVRYLPPLTDTALREQFPYAKVFRMEGYENRILACSGSPLVGAVFKQHLAAICRRYPRCRSVEQRYISSTPNPKPVGQLIVPGKGRGK